MRLEYETEGIDASTFAADPFTQFDRWLEVAVTAGLDEPNAMVVATVDEEGQPWSRYLLLKGVTDGGFEFYTNYESNKSRQMDRTGRASLTFGWNALRRQVNIAGTVRRVDPAVSDHYWSVRPRGSQLGGWASEQSRPLADRQELLDRYEEADRTHGEDVPRPEHWGGWRVEPHTVEFWQGRANRLHDRLRYVTAEPSTADSSWDLLRLAP